MSELPGTLFDITAEDHLGQAFFFSTLRGKVTLIVNVASQCSLASKTYSMLQTLQTRYQHRGFTVVATPCNQFARQEPDDVSLIRGRVHEKFAVSFPF